MDPVTIQITPKMIRIKLMPNICKSMMLIICTRLRGSVKFKICINQKMVASILRIQRSSICRTLKILNWVLNRAELQVLAEMTKA